LRADTAQAAEGHAAEYNQAQEGCAGMKVIVGVSGGIAAYKAAELVRALQQQALDVHVTMTEAAQQFVRPLTFAALTGHRVLTSLWEDAGATGSDAAIEHIAEAQSCDALVIAPATADLLARMAHGLAHDFLTTLYLATPAPVLVAPAMNVQMWEHPATQANVATLVARGVQIIPPESGSLACGMVGSGRLAEVETIVRAVVATLHRRQDMAQETVLITAGGTREPIDPVRYVGNRSSGKMGYALAEAAQQRGARVLLISAPTQLQPPAGCKLIPIQTAEQMRAAVLEHLPLATLVIKAAAVADFRPRMTADQKIKRTGPITLELEPTGDILAEVVQRRQPGTLVIGFAAETQDPLEHGRGKLARKGADAIVINDVARAGIGFESDRNAVTFLTESRAIDLPEMSKRNLADRILDEVLALRRNRNPLSEVGAAPASRASADRR
jgi:phosphopantothenoylcysteine decarboxylase/phosphopantothenate--cysteine ligase